MGKVVPKVLTPLVVTSIPQVTPSTGFKKLTSESLAESFIPLSKDTTPISPTLTSPYLKLDNINDKYQLTVHLGRQFVYIISNIDKAQIDKDLEQKLLKGNLAL